ncbi:MAG TPA: cupredoxin domain-containing protein [Actinomycetota bacterium]|nr:cupredoxin domain-containing protein [Actinomycetota bacterium]
MPRRLLAVLAVAVLSAAACGGSSQDEPDPPPRDEDAGGGAEEDAAGALSIRASDFSFDPDELSVEPGDDVSIELVNAGNVAHTFTASAVQVDVTADIGGTALAGFQAPDEDTVVEFICRFHPGQMNGRIVVGSGGTGGGGSGGGGSGEGSGEDDFDY